MRASAGIFYDWLNSNNYEQTLRANGLRQQELNVTDPSYPDPGNLGVAPPTNKYLLGDDLRMARNVRFSAGIDRAITSRIRVGTTYARVKGSRLMRGLNLNPPVDGVRANAVFGNIVEVIGDASSLQHTLNTFLQVNILPPSPNPGKERWNWKRTNFGVNYQLGKLENNTDGAFAVPATGSLAAEWGPASSDVRQRFNVFFLTQALRNANVNFNVSMASAAH